MESVVRNLIVKPFFFKAVTYHRSLAFGSLVTYTLDGN